MRLFVAIEPPPSVLDLLAALPRPPERGVRWTRRDQWHVTLRFLGEVADPAPVAAALDAATLAPAVARLGPRVEVLGRHVVCVPVGGVDELAAGVAAAVGDLGGARDDRPFRGHVTLARTGRDAARSAARTIVRGLADHPVSAAFPVDAVHLVRSRLGGGPARYETLHVRRLDGG